MEHKELIKWLKENLSIQLEKDYGYYGEESVVVKLKVDGEIISEDSVRID